MPHAALQVIRPMVNLSSRLAPGFTGRAAFRLFCTPLGARRAGKGHPALAAAREDYAQAEISHITHGCGYVRLARFRPAREARGRVLVLHGWGAQGLFMAGFARALTARGYEVLIPDFPGHGGSSGRKLNFPLAIEAIAALARAESQAFCGVIGHSFGGAVAMAAIAGGVPLFPRLGAERLVTISAPAEMAPYGRYFSKMLGLTPTAHMAFEREVLAVAGRPMESFSGEAYLAEQQLPTLLIHAPDDKEIAFEAAERMARVGSHVQLHVASGLGHRRILFDGGVQEKAAAFIAAE